MNIHATPRLQGAFEGPRAEGRTALITYMIPGHPSEAEGPAHFDAMVEGGADIVEVGIPFSDPLADGATNQKAAFQALENGITVAKCIEFAREARARHPETGLVLMTYLNPVLAYGLDAFAGDAAAAGVDGVIVVDLPVEESAEASRALRRRGLDLIFMVAPTSPDDRISRIASQASGFIYCVSVTGTTGVREGLPAALPDFLARVRRCTSLPLAVGFGMSRREQIEALTGIADGVVVGSAITNLIGEAEPQERARLLREYVEVLSGRRSA